MNAAPQLPALATRQEIADFCNAGHMKRKKPITPRIVKGWQENGWITPHPCYRKPARYCSPDIMEFLAGKIKIKGVS